MQQLAPRKHRRPCTYAAFLPERLADLRLELPLDVAGVVSEAEAAIAALNEGARPALAPLARLLLRTESVASSKIEGMRVGVRELARAEVRLESGSSVGPRALEVLANIDSMSLAIHEAASVESFSIEEIVAIHRKLLERTPHAKISGRLRTAQNWIGGNDYDPCGADFVPPPPEYVVPLLEDLCEAIDDDLLPPLVQAALVHAQFETIHPFDDGNGRTGRALIHVVLRRRGLAPAYVPPVSVVLAANRARYISGLTGFRGEGAVEWIEYFSAAAAGAARLAKSYLDEARALGGRWRQRLAGSARAPRADAAAWAILDVLPAHPLITAPIAAAATGRSKPAVYQALAQLESAGVLLPLSKNRYNQAWEADGLLDLLARLESGELPVGDDHPPPPRHPPHPQ